MTAKKEVAAAVSPAAAPAPGPTSLKAAAGSDFVPSSDDPRFGE